MLSTFFNTGISFAIGLTICQWIPTSCCERSRSFPDSEYSKINSNKPFIIVYCCSQQEHRCWKDKLRRNCTNRTIRKFSLRNNSTITTVNSEQSRNSLIDKLIHINQRFLYHRFEHLIQLLDRAKLCHCLYNLFASSNIFLLSSKYLTPPHASFSQNTVLQHVVIISPNLRDGFWSLTNQNKIQRLKFFNTLSLRSSW